MKSYDESMDDEEGVFTEKDEIRSSQSDKPQSNGGWSYIYETAGWTRLYKNQISQH